MKKTTLVTLIFLSFISISFSQTPQFGFDLGVSLNRAAYKPAGHNDRRFFCGFDGGIVLEIPASDRIMIQPELNYLITGLEWNDGVHRQTIKLQYVSIPLLAKIKVVDRLNVVIGAQNCFLLSAWSDPTGEPSKRIKEQFKFNDIMLVGGVEYKLKSGLFFGARYNYSIDQIAEDEMEFEMNNRYVGIKVGYIFGPGKK